MQDIISCLKTKWSTKESVISCGVSIISCDA